MDGSMTMFRFASRFLIAFVLATAVGIPASAQTASTYYTVPSIAALKALTARPAVVEVVDANPGIFNWSTIPCSTADDVYQVTPTSGPAGCYTRMGPPFRAGALTGTSQAWGNQLLESVPGDISDIAWRSNGAGTQTSRIWLGNTRNYFGRSTRATRDLDPPNVTYATNAQTLSGSPVLNFASTTGVSIGDYVNGSTDIPTSAVVQSVGANTVTLDQNVTGTIPSGTSLSFISPGLKGFQATDFVMIKNTGSVKASNAVLTLAWCTRPGTYCSPGNDVALYDGTGAVKLVGREIDIDFGANGGLSDGNSGGLFINTFNGSGVGGTGNGPAVQTGGVSGYWSVAFECNGVVTAGACLSMGGGNPTINAMLDVTQGTFGSGAILVGNNNGSNGQIIRFNTSGGAPATLLYADSSNIFTINNLAGSTAIVGGVSTLTADSVIGLKVRGATNLLRVDPQAGGMVMQSTNAIESAFAPLLIDGSMVTIRTNGTTTAAAFDASQNATFSAVVRANTGFSANGTAGVTATKTVRDAAGTGTCTLVFTMGLYTGGTC